MWLSQVEMQSPKQFVVSRKRAKRCFQFYLTRQKSSKVRRKSRISLTWTACATSIGVGGMGVKAWLRGVHPRLAEHEGVFSEYGIGHEDDLRALDAEDVEALAAQLRAQSVLPQLLRGQLPV